MNLEAIGILIQIFIIVISSVALIVSLLMKRDSGIKQYVYMAYLSAALLVQTIHVLILKLCAL